MNSITEIAITSSINNMSESQRSRLYKALDEGDGLSAGVAAGATAGAMLLMGGAAYWYSSRPERLAKRVKAAIKAGKIKPEEFMAAAKTAQAA